MNFRVGKAFGAPAIAEITCPDPRIIAMRITAGEGVGSIVETHAAPCRPALTGGRAPA